MITPGYLQHMARYNRWQNGSIYGAADGLSDADRRADRGAFFKSIHRTLSHLYWGDMLWMSRFDGGEAPDVDIKASPDFIADWDELKDRRVAMDRRIADWAAIATEDDIAGEYSWYSGALERQVTVPKAACLMQLYNHQTHHRGQVHAMLTAAGAGPDDTDIPFMPETA